MDDTLQRLLDAEARAQSLAREAEEAHERAVAAAVQEARDQDEHFSARVPELRRSWVARAEERAAKTIAEIERRFDERHEALRDTAERREEEALEAAFRVLLDVRL